MIHNIDFLCNHSTSKINFSDVQKTDEKMVNTSLMIEWEEAVMPLTKAQRIIFFVLTVVICTIGYLGNVLVLYVNFTRKQRLLFRTCLISLAISDIMYIQVTTLVYLPRLFISQSALWILGALPCALLPFMQTLAILVNSILLVCIAMDRYMAVVRISKSQWEPGKLFCLTCCVLIWGMAAGISSPMIEIYQQQKVIVVPRPENVDDELTYYIGYVCASHKDQNSLYFSIVFSFIFAPLVLTFLWMNSVVAREIWQRRKFNSKSSPQPPTISTAPSTLSIPSSSPTNTQSTVTLSEVPTGCTERRRRQERLFRVILLLMFVFFICRLPTWVFLIIQLNTALDDPILWIFYFSFGILACLNCALNPYLYTFMSETIKLVSFLGNIIRGIFYSICKIFMKKQ